MFQRLSFLVNCYGTQYRNWMLSDTDNTEQILEIFPSLCRNLLAENVKSYQAFNFLFL
jgi:hypothetical protein